jgi:RNA polymerase sigma factor (sigma-70 family)
VTPDEYRRARQVARRACAGWALTREDWEEVEQDAAVAAWRHGLQPSTRSWAAAHRSAQKIQGRQGKKRPVIVPNNGTEWRKAAPVDVEGETVERMTVERLLSSLPAEQRIAVEETVLEGRTQQQVADRYGVADSTITRRRQQGLARLRKAMR